MHEFRIDWLTADPIVVFDLEYTSWEGAQAEGWSRPGQHREVIQIGAVRLAGAAWDEVDAIEVLVKPRVNPVLSDYIVAFTGITNDAMAARGLELAPALDRFAAFAGRQAPLVSNGEDGDIVAESCALQNLEPPLSPYRYVNVHDPLVAALGRPPGGFSSADLPALLGLVHHGRSHTALADARAIAAALRHLRAAGRL